MNLLVSSPLTNFLNILGGFILVLIVCTRSVFRVFCLQQTCNEFWNVVFSQPPFASATLMAPSDHLHTSASLQIPTTESQGSRHYNSSVVPQQQPTSGSSQARPISVAAHTVVSSQNQHSSSRRQRASHNVVSPSSTAHQPERSQPHDNPLPLYTDVYSHPAAVAYAAAHPRRTIPKFGPYLLLQTLGEGEFGKVKLGLHCQWGEEVAVKLIRRGNVDSSVRMSKIEREIEVLKVLVIRWQYE